MTERCRIRSGMTVARRLRVEPAMTGGARDDGEMPNQVRHDGMLGKALDYGENFSSAEIQEDDVA